MGRAPLPLTSRGSSLRRTWAACTWLAHSPWRWECAQCASWACRWQPQAAGEREREGTRAAGEGSGAAGQEGVRGAAWGSVGWREGMCTDNDGLGSVNSSGWPLLPSKAKAILRLKGLQVPVGHCRLYTTGAGNVHTQGKHARNNMTACGRRPYLHLALLAQAVAKLGALLLAHGCQLTPP